MQERTKLVGIAVAIMLTGAIGGLLIEWHGLSVLVTAVAFTLGGLMLGAVMTADTTNVRGGDDERR